MDGKFKNIIIAHDMTKKQREECRTLVQEAKDKEQQEGQEEWIYRVRGPPTDLHIIKLKKRR